MGPLLDQWARPDQNGTRTWLVFPTFMFVAAITMGLVMIGLDITFLMTNGSAEISLKMPIVVLGHVAFFGLLIFGYINHAYKAYRVIFDTDQRTVTAHPIFFGLKLTASYDDVDAFIAGRAERKLSLYNIATEQVLPTVSKGQRGSVSCLYLQFPLRRVLLRRGIRKGSPLLDELRECLGKTDHYDQ